MTSASPQPPAWAQSWIEMLAPARRRDAMLGDLLEEYHETQVPECGVAAANRWFARQARSFLWSASLLPAVLFFTLESARSLMHAVLPIPSLAAPAVFVIAGLRLGLSTRRVDGAFLVAPAVTVVACGLGFAVALAAFGVPAVVHPSPAATAVLWEATDIPVQIIFPVGIVLTLLGAAIGTLLPGRPLKGRVS